ncbi:MAG TPA: DUF1638 domain-containing protein [Trebonia sp.]
MSNTVPPAGGGPPAPPDHGGLRAPHLPRGEDDAKPTPPPHGGCRIEVIACGALAAHIREIAARRGWPVTVRPLPAALHNRPEKIKAEAERMLAAPQTKGARPVLGYADCGTYGALAELGERSDAKPLPGLHCYDLYAGQETIEQLFAEEPGTYLLTDYLIKSFTRSVIRPLGLDRHPELWPDYFGHYTRLVWLVQRSTPDLEEAATQIASQFNLPLTRIDTGLHRLEAALTPLIEPPS